MVKKRTKKVYPDDDGRVIAPMNVDGMPWFNRYTPRYKVKKEGMLPSAETPIQQPEEKLTKKENAQMLIRLYAVLIPLTLVFVGAAALVIYLLTIML